jgi:hypothetical protein
MPNCLKTELYMVTMMKKNNNHSIRINSYSDLFSILKKLAEAPENQPIQALSPQTNVSGGLSPTVMASTNQSQQNNSQSQGNPPESSPYDPHVEYQQDDLQSIKRIKLDRRITVEEIVEKINSIRAGRSLSNKNIRMQLEVYFDQLTEDEKLTLFAFLAGISQIVTGEVSGKIATDPDDVSYHQNIQKKIDEEEQLKGNNVDLDQQVQPVQQQQQQQQQQSPPIKQMQNKNLPISVNAR